MGELKMHRGHREVAGVVVGNVERMIASEKMYLELWRQL
jgi:hypothetical protein